VGYDPGALCAGAAIFQEETMVWELPSFVEIEMNAEIGSYQEDFDGI
jgi:hypothetical protein